LATIVVAHRWKLFRVSFLPAAFEDEDEKEHAAPLPQPQAPSGLDDFFDEP
jgi:hypothetical protein